MEFADAVGVPIPKIEKLPGVRRVGLEINNGERKLQMANTAKQRTAYVSNESFETEGVTGREFILARITENEPGYLVAGYFSTLERAQEVARQRNALNDLNEDAVADIRGVLNACWKGVTTNASERGFCALQSETQVM